MAKWLRPSGTVIETNDLPSTLQWCLDAGWTRAEKIQKPPLNEDGVKPPKKYKTRKSDRG